MSIWAAIHRSDFERLIASLPEEILFNTCIADSNHRNKSYINFIIVAIFSDILVKLHSTFFLFCLDKSFNISSDSIYRRNKCMCQSEKIKWKLIEIISRRNVMSLRQSLFKHYFRYLLIIMIERKQLIWSLIYWNLFLYFIAIGLLPSVII